MVVGVDEVVHDAGMIAVLLPQRLQDAGGLELHRQVLLQRVGLDHGQGQERAGLGVVRVGRMQGLEDFAERLAAALVHRRPVAPLGCRPRAFAGGGAAAVEARQGGDVVPLARRPSAGPLGLLHRLQPLRPFLRGGGSPDRVEPGHGRSPVRHGARGVGGRRGLEGPAGLVVEEGMEQGDPAQELRLRLRAARSGEVHLPHPGKVSQGPARRRGEGLRRRRGRQRQEEDESQDRNAHALSPLSRSGLPRAAFPAVRTV